MTIDEAIKILENERKNHHSYSTDIIGQAEGLGIEALKFYWTMKTHPQVSLRFQLLGETKD